MPPLLPRPSMFPRATTAPSSSSTTSTLSRVLFSTTAARPQQQIPPESPLFINVPNPPQDQSIEAQRELKPVKGFMPVPRQVFKHRDSHRKPTAQWLDKAAPEPTSARSAGEPRSDVQAWKRRMAASRRENIREGLRDLYARKQQTDRRRLEAQTKKLAANKAAAMAPEREDERLTRATVTAGTLKTAVLPDPQRFDRALESRARTEAVNGEKSEARRDAIQELYMNARSFIVTEADLEKEVDRLFAPDYWEKMGQTATGYGVENIWDLEGKPMTVARMLNEVTGTTNEVIKGIETESTRTVKRQKEVAEELTGGKMDLF